MLQVLLLKNDHHSPHPSYFLTCWLYNYYYHTLIIPVSLYTFPPSFLTQLPENKKFIYLSPIVSINKVVTQILQNDNQVGQ